MVTNLAWLGALATEPAQIPTLDFVDEYTFSPAQLDDAFGKPAERAVCPRSAYRLYRPADGALAHLYRHFEWLPGQVLQRLGQVALPGAAWAADEAFVEGDAVHASGSLPSNTPLLITAQDFPPGRLQVWIAYSFAPQGPGASLHWDVTALDPSGNAVASVGRGELAANGQSTRIELPLAARPAGAPGLGISVTASGAVDARLEAIGLRVSADR
jgi:hypothetical protein